MNVDEATEIVKRHNPSARRIDISRVERDVEWVHITAYVTDDNPRWVTISYRWAEVPR